MILIIELNIGVKHMISVKLDRNHNGNKIIKVNFSGTRRGFSVQTDPITFPETNRMTNDDMNSEVVIRELKSYVEYIGTPSQKKALGIK